MPRMRGLPLIALIGRDQRDGHSGLFGEDPDEQDDVAVTEEEF